MSEPWVLDDWDDTLDVNDVVEGEEVVKIQIRDHYVFARSRLLTAVEVGLWGSQVGNESGTISARLGGTSFSRTMTSGAYICVKNKVEPYDHPAAFGRERQIWEYYSKWRDAPSGWMPEGGA